jgi:serine/threonine-protein kinase
VADESEEGARVLSEGHPTQHAPLTAPVSATLRAAPAVGERVGAYVIERTIGHGGMGIVVAARHETRGDMVAIKLLHPKAAKDAVQVERFVREARATARIKSEHVVRVLDAGAEESTGSPFIVMELLEGRDLGYILSSFGAIPITKSVDYIIQICEAVAAAHALGIIHRDLKPSNFFLTHRADGTALLKVLDFGISKAAQSDGSPDPRLTETQAVFGSPTYMSPEQIRSSKNVDERSDVWSLGVALFEMLTGKLPFVADNVAGLLASVIADPPFRVSVFTADVPPELEAIVLGCLEKEASRRIGSATELAVRLGPYASPEGARLAAAIERAGRGGARVSQFPPRTTTAPNLADARISAMPPMPPVVPLPPLSRPSAPAPAVVFGTTGTDLSATGPAAFRTSVRRGPGRAVALVAGGVLVATVAVGGIAYVAREPKHASDGVSSASGAATSPGAPSAETTLPGLPPAAPPVAAASAAAIAPPTSSASPSLSSASSPAPPPPPRRGKPPAGAAGQGHAPPRAGAPAAPHSAPPAPASPNLDSRF